MFKHRISALLVTVALVQAVTSAASAADLRPVKVRMDWQYQGYHAPFFVALDKGYYKEAGLQVELFAGVGSSKGVKIVASGTEEFGLIDSGVAAIAISKGAPVKVVAGFIQANPTVIISWKDNPVTEPKDLEGKTAAWVPGVASNFMVTALMRANGIDEKKLKKVSTTREASEALFLEKKTDIGKGFVNATWAAYMALGRDKDMQILRVSDWGVNVLSLGIVVNTELLSAQPDVVRKFVAATLKGLRYTLDNPEEGWKTVVKHKPEVDPKQAQFGWENSGPLLTTPNTEGKPLGWMSEKDWKETLDFLETYMELAPRLSPGEYYTNEFATG